MKLAVSNIAWENAELAEHLALLHDLGCQGVELAPSCIWPEPVEATAGERARLRDLVQGSGLEVTGFHALLFTRPDLQLFKDRDGLNLTVEYLVALARLCSDLEGRLLVFGSPRNRARHGRDYRECQAWSTEAFHATASRCAPLGVTLCIEPLAPDETDFIMSCDEGARLVETVGHANFQLHLDARALRATGEDLAALMSRYGRRVQHFHVAEAGLAPPGSTGTDHAGFGKALRDAGYQHYVSIEMRRGFGNTREVVSASVAYVMQHYLHSTNPRAMHAA